MDCTSAQNTLQLLNAPHPPNRQLILNTLNTFYKKEFSLPDNLNIIRHKHFFLVCYQSKTVGIYSILVQYATSSFILYSCTEDIDRDRSLHDRYLDILLTNHLFNIYSNIDQVAIFLGKNLSYFYSYQDQNNTGLFKKTELLLTRLCPDLNRKFPLAPAYRTAGNKIKIGFASDFLTRFHSVSKDRLGVVKSFMIDPRFETKIVTRTLPTKEDAFFNQVVFGQIDIVPTMFLHLSSGKLSEQRQQIADERFDVLVYPEISMDQNNRLIAHCRLAPIQITTWGHSDTSGLSNIDYYISSKWFNTSQDAQDYSEKLVLLNSLGTYYYNIKKYMPDELKLDNDTSKLVQDIKLRYSTLTTTMNIHLYGCLQIYFKIHPTFIEMLNLLLEMDPLAVIILLDNDTTGQFRPFISKMIPTKKNYDRIYFIGQQSVGEFAQIIRSMDIILDYYPFGGFNSIMEAFVWGKIVITRPSRKISGKFTTGLYKKMGIEEFICFTTQEYVKKAIQYASNEILRKEYEGRILENVSKIYEEEASSIEWKEWVVSKVNQ